MAVDHDGCACLRETARNGCTNGLSRSGNDRDASVEVCLVHGRHQRAPLLGLDSGRSRGHSATSPESSKWHWSRCPYNPLKLPCLNRLGATTVRLDLKAEGWVLNVGNTGMLLA